MDKTITHTFFGDGTFPSADCEINWQLGFEHGYQYAIQNYKLGKNFNPFPGDSNIGWFGNGFAEGVISGRGFVHKRDYPDMVSMSLKSSTGVLGDKNAAHWYIISFKNGNYIRVDCEN